MNLPGIDTGSAVIISPCGLYRYLLLRDWRNGPTVNFVMLNPSTADATQDDPTIRRCAGFAKAWGYGTLAVTNLYAFRATNPAELQRAADPVGPANDDTIKAVALDSALVVCAWGALGGARAAVVERMLGRLGVQLYSLGMTKGGQPRHPLYLPARCQPRPFTITKANP